MSNKSKRNRHNIQQNRKINPAAEPSTILQTKDQPIVAEPAKPGAAAPKAVPGNTTATIASYPYIFSDMKRIAIVAAALAILLVILYFTVG